MLIILFLLIIYFIISTLTLISFSYCHYGNNLEKQTKIIFSFAPIFNLIFLIGNIISINNSYKILKKIKKIDDKNNIHLFQNNDEIECYENHSQYSKNYNLKYFNDELFYEKYDNKYYWKDFKYIVNLSLKERIKEEIKNTEIQNCEIYMETFNEINNYVKNN